MKCPSGFVIFQGLMLYLLVSLLPRPGVAQCPTCYNDNTIPQGHGAAPDGSGRRVINIYIDSSWNSSPGVTNTQIWNATASAVSK